MPSFTEQRHRMVERYKRSGYIKSEKVEEAILAVPREKFMDPRYREHAYLDRPFPIPGDGRQTISAPYMYPVTYEPLQLESGQCFMEIGAGSGYGAALAYELVGREGVVVSIEINPDTYRFAAKNLVDAGYEDVRIVQGDGSLGYPLLAPYDAVSITASTPDIPPPILKQMAEKSKLVAPVGSHSVYGQDLLLVEKMCGAISQRKLMSVAYVPLTGKHGHPE
ncbi:protein-L-isoaspartate O-methyltransferase [Candidatus Bathyarchaeota archaeon]|nr:protein-L-isoaspartate O-methyltransferase [Candidatus Bathyarchaeota archaeon]